MKRAIITGATGAIGTALINELIKVGVEVLIFCRKDSKRVNLLPNHPLVTIKYCALDGLEKVENDTGKTYDTFYHFAWDGTFGADRNDMYRQNLNVKYSLDAVAAAKRFGCKRFIGAGSQAEYGRSDNKLSATTPAFPENGYGIAKLCAGQLTRLTAAQLEIKHIWVRILSVYGPHDGANTMVSSSIQKFKNGQAAQFTKGEQLWDYLYSGDAAKAFALLGDKGKDGKVYVLGSGNERPLKDYINDIAAVVNPQAEIKFGAVPYSDKQVMRLCADISELTKDTGWRPETEFKQGIKNILNTL
ncbi:MAG: NAD(P)-dependent oxidoreductase [Clostridia bacterium]|nr:NAD(P)-dependent oxidoreductase [Clostridia bacterium]